MTDLYCRMLFRVTLAKIAQNTGFHAASVSSLDVLQDILSKYMHDLCDNLRIATELCERTEPLLDDVGLVFSQMGVSLREIIDYINQVSPVHLPHKVPDFPVKRPEKLNIPRKDHPELKTRPDFIPPYLPLLQGEEPKKENEVQTETNSNLKAGNRKSLLPQKNEQLRGDEWLNELYDCDAIKAGIVKLVEIHERPKTPPPPPPPKLELVAPLPAPHEHFLPEKSVKFHSPFGQNVIKPLSKTPKSAAKYESRLLQTPIFSAAQVFPTAIHPVEKSTDTSFSIDECISSVIEQTSACSQAAAPPKRKQEHHPKDPLMSQLFDLPVGPEKPSVPVSIGFFAPEKLKAPPAKQQATASKNSTSPRVDSSKWSDSCVINAQEIVSAFTEEWTKNAKIAISSAASIVNVKETITTISTSTTAIDEKIIAPVIKKSHEEKESKKRKADSSASPATTKRFAPPPMPVVDTSTLFQPDVKVVTKKAATAPVPPSAASKTVKKQEKSAETIPSTIEKISTANLQLQPAPSVSPIVTQAAPPAINTNAAAKPGPPMTHKKFGALKIKLQLPSAAERSSESENKGGKKRGKKPTVKTNAVEKPPPVTKKQKTSAPAPVPDDAERRPPSSQNTTNSPAKLKVPKLILKLGPKPTKREEKKPETAQKVEPNVAAYAKNEPPPFNDGLILSDWSNECFGQNRQQFSPKPSSLHSNSHTAASSPPPPTPSPRSLSPSSPIAIFIPESEPVVDSVTFEKSVEFPQTSYTSVSPIPPPLPLPPPVEKPQPVPSTSPATVSQGITDRSEENEEEKIWYCPVCQIPYEEGADMIACDKCDNWFHWTCVGLTKAPPDHEQWYCKSCFVKKPKAAPRKRLKK